MDSRRVHFGLRPLFVLAVGLFSFSFSPEAAAAVSAGTGLQQYRSGGHVLGFDEAGYYTSNGTYALRVGFEGSAGAEPVASGAGAKPAGAMRLRRQARRTSPISSG